MHKRTKAVAITPEVRARVEARDNYCCIFCGRPGRGEAHFIGRAQGGLGVEQNILTVCRECHFQLDNGQATKLYRQKAEAYLRAKYNDFDPSRLIYKKGL